MKRLAAFPSSPADERRHRLDAAEDQAGAQRLAKTGTVQPRALADGGREGIGGHAQGQQHDRQDSGDQDVVMAYCA